MLTLSPIGPHKHNNPYPGGKEIYNSSVIMSDLCSGVEKKILKEIMHCQTMTYMDIP